MDDWFKGGFVFQKEKEFIPAYPGDNVTAADAVLELLGRIDQHLVAKLVAPLIIALLEMIQIKDGKGIGAVRSLLQTSLNALLGGSMVEKSG